MTTPATEDLARVTVISPSRRIDVALPGATSLAECLPTIVKFSGYEATTSGEAVHAWVLQRLGEDPLDVNRRISALNLRDGETLHLRQRENVMPDAAFDDVVDAVTTATAARPSWTPAQSQWAGVVVMCAVLVGLPLLLLWRADPENRFGTVLEAGLALFGSMASGIGAIVLSRALGRHLPAVGMAWSSVVLAAAGGLFVLPTADWPLRVLLACACTVTAAGMAWLAARVQPYAHLAVTLAAVIVLVVCMVIVLIGGLTAQVAAVTVALVLAVTALLPMVSYHTARVAMPNLPSTSEALMNDEQPVQTDIVTRALTADRLLGAYLGATGLSVACLMVPVLVSHGWIGLALGFAVSLALMLRARAFVGRAQRSSLLVAGLVVGLAALALLLVGVPPLTRVIVAVAVTIAATVALAGYSTVMYDRILAPGWGRLGDVLEWLAIMAIIPLVLGLLDVYTMVMALASGS